MSEEAVSPDVLEPLVGHPPRSSASADDALGFLQRRLGMFCVVFASFGAFFLVFRAVLAIALGRSEEFNSSFYAHAAAVMSSYLIWWWCRGPSRTELSLRIAEAASLFLPAILYTGMMQATPLVFGSEQVVVEALTYACFGRAVYVPSSAKRTFVLTLLAGIPVFIGAWFNWSTRFESEGLEVYRIVLGETFRTSEVAAVRTVVPMAWWVLTVGTCTLASHVIYGLRREVQSIRKLGQYSLERKIGEGGMGVVYEAKHGMLRRPTAVKLLPPDKSAAPSIARFEREVQLTARLSHPNTVTVFDFGRTPDGVFYYAMELLQGANLSEVVEVGGRLPEARVVHILSAVCGALVEAHDIGLIHRDIKPSNIMLCQQGGRKDVPKVLDFGLVKEVTGAGQGTLTNAGIVAGTPQYLCPEGLTSPDTVDARADLYALGAVAYFLLVGEHVFSGNTVVEICAHQLHSAPVPPSQRLGRPVSPRLEDLILRCLAKNRDDRPQSARELLQELTPCAEDSAWTPAEADIWWAEHEPALLSQRQQSSRHSSDKTIARDLARTSSPPAGIP